MITINNRDTGIHIYGDTFHYCSKFKGFTLSIIRETDNIRITLSANRKLGWWPGLIEDKKQLNADFLAFATKYFDTLDSYLLAKFKRHSGGFGVGDINIAGNPGTDNMYLTTYLNFTLEGFSFNHDMYTHEFIDLYKRYNSALTDFIQRYKKQNDISIKDVRKYASWKRYVKELRDVYLKSDVAKEWKWRLLDDNLPF